MDIESQSYRGALIVADDDEGERYLLERAIEDAGIRRHVIFLESGEGSSIFSWHWSMPNSRCPIS